MRVKNILGNAVTQDLSGSDCRVKVYRYQSSSDKEQWVVMDRNGRYRPFLMRAGSIYSSTCYAGS